jgi:hypothetical protein
MVDSGAWVSKESKWMRPEGKFDWKAVARLQFAAEAEDMRGKLLFLDSIMLSKIVSCYRIITSSFAFIESHHAHFQFNEDSNDQLNDLTSVSNQSYDCLCTAAPRTTRPQSPNKAISKPGNTSSHSGHGFEVPQS